MITEGGRQRFSVKLSIEKDAFAHSTLTLRAFFRRFPKGEAPPEYYAYLKGETSRKELFEKFPKEAAEALEEAQCRTLGEDSEISTLISERLGRSKDWVLIGGPPCQAYSLVGRSRMWGAGRPQGDESPEQHLTRISEQRLKFEGDHRHLLYREYLKIIEEHRPSVFVMENVKGILSSKVKGAPIFPKILADLANPVEALGSSRPEVRYRICSLVTSAEGQSNLKPVDYLIRSEDYGIPQTRHRVILLGVREDFYQGETSILEESPAVSVKDAIGDLPRLTSGLSKNVAGKRPYDALAELKGSKWWHKLVLSPSKHELVKLMARSLDEALKVPKRGVRFAELREPPPAWYADKQLSGVCNHETRSHIREDLWRYFFCASYARLPGLKSPRLADFPRGLLPAHKNVDEAIVGGKFGDRFRVQLANLPSSTVTSHISKDGHYFIHYDPEQYRSLTVREAARLQTFPDNYLFEGPRTQQFHQVGNAVPPKLAYQIAEVVSGIFQMVDSQVE